MIDIPSDQIPSQTVDTVLSITGNAQFNLVDLNSAASRCLMHKHGELWHGAFKTAAISSTKYAQLAHDQAKKPRYHAENADDAVLSLC